MGMVKKMEKGNGLWIGLVNKEFPKSFPNPLPYSFIEPFPHPCPKKV